MLQRIAMMNLVLRRADENMFHELAPGYPDVALVGIRAYLVEEFSSHTHLEIVQERDDVTDKVMQGASNQTICYEHVAIANGRVAQMSE